MRSREEYPRRATKDLRLSMATALADHLRTLEFKAGARPFRLAQVFEEWAGWGDKISGVCAAVQPDERLVYQTDQRSPSLLRDTWWPEGEAGWALYQKGEAVCDMAIQVRAPTTGERAGVIFGVENTFVEPRDGSWDDGSRGGLLLEMTTYWGMKAHYQLKEQRVLDDADSAAKGRHEAVFILSVTAPQVFLDVVRPFRARITEKVDGDPSA